MSYASDYFNAINKRKKKDEEEKESKSSNKSYAAEYFEAVQNNISADLNDIAPVRSTVIDTDEEEKKVDDPTYFKKGAFDDGYQFGDVTKTVVGTLTDINENINTAVIDATENLIDTTAYGIGAVGGLFSKDFKDDVGKFIAKEILQPEKTGETLTALTSPLGIANQIINKGETEENSVLGEKADGLVQSGAHLVGSAALQAVGVPTWLTMGVNAFGGEIESAFQQDATFGEAGISGGISAVSEIVFEKISGGVKFKSLGGTWDEGLQQFLKNNISNKVGRTIAKYVTDMVGEGTEEVLTEAVSAVGRKLTYASEKEWDEILSSEDLFDAFIGGAVISGIAGGGQIVNSARNGTDYTSGLTANEEKVVKKLYDDKIAESQKSGKKLKSGEKAKIYDGIVEELKKGYIPTDTIEGVLGGKTFEEYKNLTEQEKSLTDEISQLENLPKEQITVKQSERLTAAREELKNLTNKDELKTRLTDGVRGLIDTESQKLKSRGSYLAESYNEVARKGQSFTVDLSKYKGKQRTAYERAMNSGVLNDTNRSHELVDTLARIEADKGIVFDYANNAKLKETGFALDGKTVNAFVKNNAVTLNVQSPKAWQSTVGHEITHILEGTAAYGELQKALFSYAESKGELANRKAALTELYNGIEADIDAELTADLVGDYLFSDKDFIKNLTGNRTVFEKIYDEIKYLCKVATGKEKADIERVKREFDKAWEELALNDSLENEATDTEIDDVKYSVSPETDTEYISAVERGDTETAQLMVDEAAKKAGYTRTLYHGTASNFNVFGFGRTGIFTTDNYDMAKTYGNNVISLYGKEGAKVLTIDAQESPHYAIRVDKNILDFSEYPLIGAKETYSTNDISLIAFREGYDVVVIKNVYDNYNAASGNKNGLGTDVVYKDSNQVKSSEAITYDDNGNVIPLSQRFSPENKDIRYSVSADSEGKQLSKEQSEYFKNSKMRDVNGNLMVMYHGSPNAGFHKFNAKFSDDGTSFFFVDSNEMAESYSGTDEEYIAKTFNTADDFNNFFAEIGAEDYEVIEEDGQFVLLDDGDEVATSDTAKGLYDEFTDYTGLGQGSANYKTYLNLTNPLVVDAQGKDWNRLPDPREADGKEGISSEFGFEMFTTRDYAEYAKQNGYNGVIFKNIYDKGGYAGENKASTVAIAFESNQIKSVENTNPTANEDIRFSVSDIDGKQIEAERISNNELDTKYSISHNDDIAQGQANYIAKNESKVHITTDELEEAQRVTNAMVDVMMKYSSILPEDKIGKVLTKNGSYDRSVENTTICVRTLAYNEFVDKVQEEIGRPLTQMESFLVSQKLYDIATDPQCLYCYVSLDRKAFNDMLLRYMQDRDTVIAKYNNSDKSAEAVNKLYEEFLNGRKDSKDMKVRFNNWIKYVDDGTQLLSLADIATEDRQSVINAEGGILAEQLVDARRYAQNASWSKIQKNYVAYRDEILKLGDRVVKNLNEHYGLRWYSFSDYSAAFIVENMQQITDASIRGLKGLSYTKDTDYAEIFAPSGMNINVSVFVNQDADGNFYIDEKQSANFEKALALREQYPNVGIVATVTNDDALRWAGEQEWSDVIIPFHIVRTGADVAEYYKWLNYTSESADTLADKDLWSAYVDSLNLKSENARKKVSKNIYPSEHKNDKATYLALCENRGLSPRFARFAGEEWYMKLVNETRLSADNSSALKPLYNLEAAKSSFQKFVDKGGYEGGWYREGVNVDDEVKIVANDVLAGKKANEVDYGRQDGFIPEALISSRKTNRQHGKHSLSNEGEEIAPVGNYSTPLNETALAPMREVIAENATPTETVAETSDIAPMPSDADAPPVMETEYYNTPDTTALDEKALNDIGKSLRDTLSLTAEETKAILEIVQEYSTTENPNIDELFNTIKEKFGEKVWKEKNQDLAEVKRFLRTFKINVSAKIKSDIADYKDFRKSIGSKLRTSKDGLSVDVAYQQLAEMYPEYFSEDIWNETDQFLRMAEVASMDLYKNEAYSLDDEVIQEAVNIVLNEVRGYKENLTRTAAEDTAKEALDGVAPAKAIQLTDGSASDAHLVQSLDNYPIKTVDDRIAENIRATETELAENRQLMRESVADYNKEIDRLSQEYLSKKDKNTKVANNIIRRIARLEKLKASNEASYAKRISDLEARVEKMNSEQYRRAMHKRDKMQEHADWAENLLGDTSTWKDKKIGLQYATNTERRNFRDIVRDENGNKDIARADAINDALNGRYNREQADVNRELAKTRKKYADLKITKAESTYIQMLGELRHNPETTLTEKDVKEFYEKHQKRIDENKVNKVIEMARQDFDGLLEQVNAVLREQGMKEIPYRQGYFPHFTNPKQNFVQKLLNWKTQDNEIPTSIAGLTETFKPVRSYQSFDKTRHGDTTDYNFLQGFDSYLEGALDWIYHIDTLQKRRAVENHIRYTHSDEGIQAKIKEVYASEEYDANEAQAQIEHILAEAKNPLNNFVQDFTTHTNILAGKKNSLDRTVEQWTNRHIYSVMTNVQNRMSANMVLANVRSALTNFIPITQSWAQVSPIRSLQATKDTIANAIQDDGIIEKSTFLTNRLRAADKLYNTAWDKVLDKAGIMFEVVDNFSSQVIWRSKYNQNLADGMTESEAIKNADQFAENVMAGRSKGNEPTLFNAKNPFVKAFTMFQLEVNNQYGYLFKDVPNDLKAETNHWKLNLAKGYTTAFIGAYVYDALMTELTGSGAALNPIGIVEDLLRDLGLFDDDEEKEPNEVVTNLVDNVVEELPFVGGLFGGGRIPIASALPYGGQYGGGLSGAIKDVSEGNWVNIGKEMMNPLLNVVLPVGGGQLKKTAQGLSMFNTDEDHPIAGSYTDSGALRFPIEDTVGNRIKAGVFGRWANENAREYLDKGYAPLEEKQIQEYMDVDLPIADYWKYLDGLKGLKKNAEKADYINSLDIEDWQKNLLMNNILDRKEDVDMSNYDDYSSYEEFDYAEKNPEKYEFFKANGISYEDYSNADEDGKAAYTWAYNNPDKFTMSKAVTEDVIQYKQYTTELYSIKADKDGNGKSISGSRKEKVVDYVNNLDLDYGAKLILFKSEYPSDDTYNVDIVNYINNRNDLTYEERVTIYEQLGFTVKDGTVYWD